MKIANGSKSMKKYLKSSKELKAYMSWYKKYWRETNGGIPRSVKSERYQTYVAAMALGFFAWSAGVNYQLDTKVRK